jgi:hypothetical protein
MPGLIHCIYTSTAKAGFSAAQLAELLRRARIRNQAAGITGMLLYTEGSFFQALEGEAGDVDDCYARIQVDPRHGKVTRIIREAIARRSFSDWTMGFSEVTPNALSEIDGLNDFFGDKSCFDGLDSGRAKKLLTAFAAGRWRSTLSEPPGSQVPP